MSHPIIAISNGSKQQWACDTPDKPHDEFTMYHADCELCFESLYSLAVLEPGYPMKVWYKGTWEIMIAQDFLRITQDRRRGGE